MKISFEIIDDGKITEVRLSHMLVEGPMALAVIAVLPLLFGRITGGILRDCVGDPMEELRLSGESANKFRRSMEDEIRGINQMINWNIVRGKGDEE